MSRLAVYAITRDEPRGPLHTGVAGEPLRWVRCGRLGAVVGEIESAPGLDRPALERHDRTVRRLAALVDGILPARFGEAVAGEPALVETLAGRSGELGDALDRVAGCVQMTLRVFGPAEAAAGPDDRTFGSCDEAAGSRDEAGAPAVARDSPVGALDPGPSDAGPGARYLAARMAARERLETMPELSALRDALRPLLRGERLRRHQTPPLLASAYDLIAGADVRRYEEICAAEGPRLAARGLRLAISGPWPPYAFGLGVRP